MATLNEPAALELQDQLRKLLAVADAAFKADPPFHFPPELLRIAGIVKRLQPFLGRENPVRVPFWNCVKALDDRKKKLGLVATLEEMVDRATSMPPSAMVWLLHAGDQGKLGMQEKIALAELKEYLDRRPKNIPANLQTFRQLLERVQSSECKSLIKGLERTIVGKEFQRVLDYTAFLDFSRQNQLWNERYMAALEDLYGFLLQFDCDLFYTKLNRVLFGRTPTATEVTTGHVRFKARTRQRNRRKATPKRNP